MAAKRGISASVLFNGFDLSAFLKAAMPASNVDLLDATVFQAAGGDKVYVVGFSDGKLSLEGFFDSDNITQAEIDDVFNSVIGSATKQIVTVSPEGAGVLANRAFLMDVDTTNYSVSSPAEGLVMASAECQSSSGVGHGVILQPLAILTTTGNGSDVDNGALTSNGGAGHLHVIAKSGTTPTLDAKIQHSVDGSAWVDLITFAQMTLIGAQRIEVTGTVNRHLRAIRTIGGGTPSFTVLVAFTRFN